MEREAEDRTDLDVIGAFDAVEEDEARTEEPVSSRHARFRLLLIISLIIGFLAALLLIGMAVFQVFAAGSQTLAESATSRPEGESAQIEGVSVPFVPVFVIFGLAFIGIVVGGWGTGLGRRRRR
ncbi:hypothetical protein [Micrococcoides hystricis]|uniref:Uncharacterized protein n=1 Tax=Micrococcoides hystricis TaxID=1572761 RepID=A0ABV6PC39_9MICC